MALSPEERQVQQQRIEDCRELYLRHGGEQHETIEREMRLMGHRDFHRRSLYRRFERGTCKAGWIDRFGWQKLVDTETQRRGDPEKKSSPPYEGGVRLQPGGGSLSTPHGQNSEQAQDVESENHPVNGSHCHPSCVRRGALGDDL